MRFLNLFNAVRLPAPMQIAERELAEAQRQLLSAQSGAEYARRMVEYHQDRIKRLTAFVRKEADHHA
jgi:hypothetical protein